MLDWGRIEDLREEVGEEDFLEVVELFLDEVDGVIDGLRTANGPDALAADLHFLKGSALNLGFDAVAELCTTGHRALTSYPGAEVDLAEIRRVYAQSKEAFLVAVKRR